MKLLVIILVIILVFGGGGGFWWYRHVKAADAATAPIDATDIVQRKDLKLIVESQGNVASNRDVDIKCKASGNIIQLPYKDVGAEVKPGEMLLQLETEDENRNLDQAKAQMTADNAQLKEAKLNYTVAAMSVETTRMRDQANLDSAKAQAADAHAKAARTKELYDAKLDSKEDLETANTTAAQADANVLTAEAAIKELEQLKQQVEIKFQAIDQINSQILQDQARLELARQNVSYCKVCAPLPDTWFPLDPPDWVISKMTSGVALGFLVQSGSGGSGGGTTVMTLSDLSHIYVLAQVDETDIGQVRVGQDCDIGADSYPGQTFDGKVVRIAPVGVDTSNVVTFEVKIEVTSRNRRLLMPEMTTNVSIVLAHKENVLTIPMQAFTSANQQGGNPIAAAGGPAEGRRGGRGVRRGGRDRNARRAAPTTQPAALAAADAKGDDIEALFERPVYQPQKGSVQVINSDGTTETRQVVVGMTDNVDYEVISGLKEGETVKLNEGTDSRFRNQGGRGGNNTRRLMRAMRGR